jgi:hypothetical protein
MIGRQVGDGIEGERLGCIFRRIKRERITVGSGRHRAEEMVVESTPAKAWVLKPLRALK